MSKRKKSETPQTETDEENVATEETLESGTSGNNPESLEEELDQAVKQREEWKDRALRSAAELDNYRKRTRKEIQESRQAGVADLAERLLDVVDNLDRALGSIPEEEQGHTLVQGVKMVRQQITDCFRAFQIEKLEPLGQPFDPYFHEAMAEMERDDAQPGTVVEEFIQGYRIGDKLLRPAKVGVAKAAGEPEEQPRGEAEPEAEPEARQDPET